MNIEVLGWGATQSDFRDFMLAMGWGEWAQDFEMVPIRDHYWKRLVDIKIDEIGAIGASGGVHFNLRFYGATSDKLIEGRDQYDVNGKLLGLFERTSLKSDIETKFGRTQVMQATTVDGVKAGYEDSVYKVRLFDPLTINKRYEVWQ